MTRILLSGLSIAALVPAAAQAAGAGVDRDRDGLPDRWERRYGLSPALPQAGRDPDRDGLHNAEEYRAGTNPRYRDTDGDLLRDGHEAPTGHDPRDEDTDGDGIADGRENPGRVLSFDGTVLEVRRTDGRRVTAALLPTASVSCAVAWGTGGGDPAPAADDGSADRQLARVALARRDGPGCDRAALRPGAVLREATLQRTAAGLVAVSVTLVAAAD